MRRPEVSAYYCRRDPHPCPKCGAVEIEHSGACDRCVSDFDTRLHPNPTVSEVLASRGVPSSLTGCAWPSFRPTAEIRRWRNGELVRRLAVAREWKPSTGPACMTLHGPAGSGKTHLAVATLRRYLETGRRSCRFVTEGELLSRIRSAFGTDAPDPVESLVMVELLCLDDLGAAHVTDWTVGVLVDLVTRRHAEGRGTVVTTNHTPAELADRLDERISSRLASGVVVAFPPAITDHRLTATQGLRAQQ